MLAPARDADDRGDQELAFGSHRDLAEDGIAVAQFQVARRYETGEGTDQNYVEAARWYSAASDMGYERAHERLARLYEPGPAFPRT